MPDPAKWILRNATTRPVELHRPEGVVVLPPRGTYPVSGPDPALEVLEKRGVLTRHAVHDPEPRAGDGPPAAADAGNEAGAPPATGAESTAETESFAEAESAAGAESVAETESFAEAESVTGAEAVAEAPPAPDDGATPAHRSSKASRHPDGGSA